MSGANSDPDCPFAAWGFTFTLLNGKVPFTKGWQNRPFTAEEASRHPGNAGVHAGTHSNNTVWIDTDTGFPHLLDTFPILKNSLISYRDNAPERGKVAIRITDRLPVAAKARRPEEKQPFAELLSTGNQAAVVGTHPSGALYQNNGRAPIEMTFVELADIWRAWTGEELTDTKADKAKRPATSQPIGDATTKPTERTHSQNSLADRVREHWTVLEVLCHFGRLGEMRSEPNGEIRVLGNGGLLIQPKGDIFYSFADSRGGDALECWAWCTGLSRAPKGRRFVEMAHDMLLAKGIEIERPTPAVDLLALCDAILTTDLGQFVPDELKAQRNGKPEYRTASTDRQIITRILQIMRAVGRTDNVSINAYRVVRGVNTDGETVQAKSHKSVEPVLRRHAWLFDAQPTDKPNTWNVSIKVDMITFPLVTPVSSAAKGGNLITSTFLHWMNDDGFSGGTSRHQRQAARRASCDGGDDTFHAFLDSLLPGLQACGILVVDGLLNAGGSGTTVDELTQSFGLTKSLVATIIRKLRDMGLIESHRQHKAPSIHIIEAHAFQVLQFRRQEFRTYNGGLCRWERTLERAQNRAEKTACDLATVGADTTQLERKIARLTEQRRRVREQLYPSMSNDDLNKWAYTPLYLPPAGRQKQAPTMPEPTALAWYRLTELTGRLTLSESEFAELVELSDMLGANIPFADNLIWAQYYRKQADIAQIITTTCRLADDEAVKAL
ncbi:MAG: winged helix-turn-helix transcriptional regulator [Chloracidobacterium sp.]|nr:winged helix-turn-helix transcriptional regulator [Chloracidobacterium sp.]